MSEETTEAVDEQADVQTDVEAEEAQAEQEAETVKLHEEYDAEIEEYGGENAVIRMARMIGSDTEEAPRIFELAQYVRDKRDVEGQEATQ